MVLFEDYHKNVPLDSLNLRTIILLPKCRKACKI
jgi:hypothetical protein